MPRTILRLLAAVAIACSAFGSSPPAAAADESTGVCDLKIGIGKNAPIDDGVALYSQQLIWWYGYGFPPGATVIAERATTVPHGWFPQTVGVDGTFRFQDYMGLTSLPPAEIVFKITDQANPGGCVDTVSGSFLGNVPYFGDIGQSLFLDEILWMYEAELTTGCHPTLYCPVNQLSRGRAATFLVRALGLPATETDFFTDDDGSSYEWSINRLAAAGVTLGCAAEQFCPTDRLDRAEMASFLARAFELPPTGTDYFTDDEANTHEADINALRAAGITTGCRSEDPTLYCPDRPLRREQMAGLLFRALNAAP